MTFFACEPSYVFTKQAAVIFSTRNGVQIRSERFFRDFFFSGHGGGSPSIDEVAKCTSSANWAAVPGRLSSSLPFLDFSRSRCFLRVGGQFPSTTEPPASKRPLQARGGAIFFYSLSHFFSSFV